MVQDPGEAPAQLPDDSHVYVDARFGISVTVPPRFQVLAGTLDPLARAVRSLDGLSDEEEAGRQSDFPVGLWDPEVTGELEDGTLQPLRLFEFDVLPGDGEPLGDEQAEAMWMGVQQYLPETLAGGDLPGFEFLEVREATLGQIPALAFEYRWDGLRPGAFGGDHACVVWALTPRAVIQAYHHCAGEQWEARRPELDAILASFEVVDPTAEKAEPGEEAEAGTE